MYACMYVCIYVCMHMQYVCMYVHLRIYSRVRKCMYVCIYICMYLRLYLYMFVCMYGRVHISMLSVHECVKDLREKSAWLVNVLFEWWRARHLRVRLRHEATPLVQECQSVPSSARPQRSYFQRPRRNTL
jgi:hypothetical protein